MENRNIAEELSEILTTGYEWNELEDFTQQLTDAEKQQYKAELVEAHLSVFSFWCYDWMCDKIQTDDSQGFIEDLLGLLDTVEVLDPDHPPYRQRAECYKLLTDLPIKTEQKLVHWQQAIDIYQNAVHHGDITLHAAWATTLLDRMEAQQQFANHELEEALMHFRLALDEFSEQVMTSWQYAAFRVLRFPFADHQYWHSRFLQELEASLAPHTAHDVFVHLLWVKEFIRMLLDHNPYSLTPAHVQQCYESLADSLAFVTHYSTDDPEKLNQLGHAFEKVATHLSDTSAQLSYYETALRYFTQGQAINPAAWTFPVYTTNVLKAMAQIYYATRDLAKVIDAFETGRELFAKNLAPGFTLLLYWGDFLIDYARLAYEFKAPTILQEAEEKLLIAKELGENYYSHPFLSLAKVALQLGDKPKCLTILQECHQILGQFINWESELADPDFEGVTVNEVLALE